jgi:hypothetical protein
VRDARGVATTDDAGRYILTGLPAGTQELVVRQIGYELAELPVRLRAGVRTMQDVQLARIVALDSVRVSAYSTRYKEFLFNRGAKIFGKYLTREMIAQRNVPETGDLLARLGGFTVVGRGSLAKVLLKKEAVKDSLVHGACAANVVIDGVEESRINDVRPSQIEALEAHVNVAKYEFPYTRAGCGLVIIWTKAWRRPIGDPASLGDTATALRPEPVH